MALIAAIILVVGLLGAGLFTGHMTLTWLALASSVLSAIVFSVLFMRYQARRQPQSPMPIMDAADTNIGDSTTESAELSSSEGARADNAAAENSTEGPAYLAPLAKGAAEVVQSSAPRRKEERIDAFDPSTEQHPSEEHRVAQDSMARVENVRVVPGRRRFHLADCRLLTGKDTEEIGVIEAIEEGFSACTVCIPDRNAVSSTG